MFGLIRTDHSNEARSERMRITVAFLVLAGMAASLHAVEPDGDYPIQQAPFTQVQFDDEFWAPRMETKD